MKKSLLVILSLILLLSGNIIPVFAEEEVPVITKMTPSDGAQEVSVVNLKAEVNFSTDMDMSTVSTASVSMTPAGIYKLVPAGARKVTIYFEKLELGTEYTLNFSKGIKSAAGAAMVPATKKFTTMQAAPQYHQITNGDMEDAEQLGVYGDGNQRRSIRFVKEENNTVLKFDVGWDEAPVLQKVYLESGKTYEMRARVKSSAAQNIWYCVNYRTASAPDTWYHTVGQINIEKDTWTDLSAAVSIPSESLTGSQDIRIVGKTKGTVLFIDDWQFYEQGYDLEPPSNTGYTAEKAAVKTMIGDGGKDEKRQLLVGLGIYESNEYAEDTQTVNRENFAKYIARLIGKGGLKMTEAAAVYQDIDVNTYEGYAGVMAAGDIIKPDPKGNFNPYGTVQYAEACRAFVVSLGYQYILEEFLPVEAAAQIGVIKGAAGNETMELTFAQLNTMLTNALKSEILIMDEIQNGAASFSKKETMEGMLSITEHTGLVTATDITGIDSTQHMESGYIQISGTAYAAPGIDAASLIGKRIRYYVDSSGDEEIVLYICDIDKLNTILTIDALDIISYSDNQYVYEEANGKTKTVRAAKDKSLIYNDKALSQYTPGHMLPAYGSVELIDNNRDGSYDVVNVKDYQTFVVGAVDKINGIIYDKFENKQIDVDLNGELRVLSGAAAAKFDGITENDILTIAQSADKTRAVIYKSNAVITGTVSRVKNDDKKRSVVFCDEVHGEIEREVNCVPGYAGADVLETGDTGIFYLDTFSNVAAFKKTAGNWQFGYFIKAIITDDEEHVEIKLLTANDKLERIVCASRLRVDEELCNTAEKAYHALAADAQLIQYKMNAAG